MHVVLIPDPFTSKLITTRSLADRLQAEGHRVTLRVPPGPLDAERLAALGLVTSLADLRVDPPARPAPDRAAIAEVTAQLVDDDADLYLIDTEAHEYVFTALAAGLPVGLLSVLFNLWKRPGVPPVHQDVVPGRGWRGSRLGVEYGWAGYRARRALQIGRSMVQRHDRRHHLVAMARDLGLDPGRLVTEAHGLIPFQYRTLPALNLNLAELELPGAAHRLNRYVGPMVNNGGVGMEPAEARAVIDRIEGHRAAAPGATMIYAAFGAYYDGDDLGFWRRAIEAIGQREDWIGVLGLGGRVTAEQLGPLPDSVLALPWAPQLDVLARADVALIHAGMTSVYECLANDAPFVVFPLGDSFDQFGTAARVAHRGIAPVGDRTSATAADIAALAEAAMADRAMADARRQLRLAMDRARSDRLLTSAIEAVAAEVSRL